MRTYCWLLGLKNLYGMLAVACCHVKSKKENVDFSLFFSIFRTSVNFLVAAPRRAAAAAAAARSFCLLFMKQVPLQSTVDLIAFVIINRQ